MHTHTRSPQFGQRSSPHLLCYIYNRQVRAGLCTRTETCTLINASTYAHKTNTHVRCMHAYINTNTHRGIHEYTWTHIHVFTCMHARMYTNACILMHAKCQHVHMHTHAHTHTLPAQLGFLCPVNQNACIRVTAQAHLIHADKWVKLQRLSPHKAKQRSKMQYS